MTTIRTGLFLTILISIFTAAHAAEGLTTDKQKFSYAVGIQLGQNINSQNIEIDNDALLKGLGDTIKRQPLQLTPQEMQQAAMNYQKQEEVRQQALGEENKLAGEKFLAENSTKKGVTELASGLQYQVLIEGEGAQPTSTDTVVVHYRGTLTDGTEFDSSYSRGEPVTISLNGVIKGWQEALPLMKVGSKWKIFVPPALGYGEEAAGPVIGPSSTLVFEIELLSIKK